MIQGYLLRSPVPHNIGGRAIGEVVYYTEDDAIRAKAYKERTTGIACTIVPVTIEERTLNKPMGG